ncbi:hypothetical protein HYU13_01635, partial [Candidatus Woesearchaeota archaeon]|nr:hypothetical protein [Candidatus Woesearchaeota archaeon]
MNLALGLKVLFLSLLVLPLSEASNSWTISFKDDQGSTLTPDSVKVYTREDWFNRDPDPFSSGKITSGKATFSLPCPFNQGTKFEDGWDAVAALEGYKSVAGSNPGTNVFLDGFPDENICRNRATSATLLPYFAIPTDSNIADATLRNGDTLAITTQFKVATKDDTCYGGTGCTQPDRFSPNPNGDFVDVTLRYLVDGVLTSSKLINSIIAGKNKAASQSFPLPRLSPGTHQLKVTGTVDGRTKDQISGVETFVIQNSPPSIILLPDFTFEEDSGFQNNILDLSGFVSDPDVENSTLFISIISESNLSAVDCSIDGNRFVDCVVQTNQSGTSGITVQASDGSLTASDTFSVTITPVNDAPTLGGIPDASIAEDAPSTAILNLSGFANDIDNASNELSFSVLSQTNNPVVGCTSTPSG